MGKLLTQRKGNRVVSANIKMSFASPNRFSAVSVLFSDSRLIDKAGACVLFIANPHNVSGTLLAAVP